MSNKKIIIKADPAGFCFGVKRAINIAYETAKNNGSKRIFTLGPIIHNPQMVNKLESKGIYAASDLNEISSDDILIIRSHGISDKIIRKAVEKGITVIDATCPFVKKAKEHAKQLEDEGYFVVVVGDKEHPEIEGVVNSLDNECLIIKDKSELTDVSLIKSKRAGIIGQTTLRYSVFAEAVGAVLENLMEVKIFNTICDATFRRQEAARNAAGEAECMIVIGGKNSSNTKKLAEICEMSGLPTFHIETKEELNLSEMEKYNRIGITAGASTPDWIIADVINFLRENGVSEQS